MGYFNVRATQEELLREIRRLSSALGISISGGVTSYGVLDGPQENFPAASPPPRCLKQALSLRIDTLLDHRCAGGLFRENCCRGRENCPG